MSTSVFVYGDAGFGEDRDGAVIGSFLTLINDVGKLVNVFACVARFDNCGKGSRVAYFSLHVLPFATPTCLLDKRNMGIRASFLLSLLT